MPAGSAKSTYAPTIFPFGGSIGHPASFGYYGLAYGEHLSRRVCGLIAKYVPRLGTDLLSDEQAARRGDSRPVDSTGLVFTDQNINPILAS
jgi:hypothetical protein